MFLTQNKFYSLRWRIQESAKEELIITLLIDKTGTIYIWEVGDKYIPFESEKTALSKTP